MRLKDRNKKQTNIYSKSGEFSEVDNCDFLISKGSRNTSITEEKTQKENKNVNETGSLTTTFS